MITRAQHSSWARQFKPLILALILTGCGDAEWKTPEVSSLTTMSYQAQGKPRDTMSEGFNAALSPLEDLGMRKREIPSILKALMENPYHLATSAKTIQCDAVQTELTTLDTLLGPDLDAPKAALSAQEEQAEIGTNLLHDGIVGLIRSQTSIIPFRSIVRRVTGADKHEKLVNQATEAGKLRRAYLKGLAEAKFGSACITSLMVVADAEAPEKETTQEHLEVAKK